MGEPRGRVAVVQGGAQLGRGAARCYLLHVSAAGITPALRAILCSPVRIHTLGAVTNLILDHSCLGFRPAPAR